MLEEKLSDRELARRVLSVARTYVDGRTEYRTNIDPEKLPHEKDAQGRSRPRYSAPEWRPWFEARVKVAQEAFLQLRACKTPDDLIGYLVGTMCTHGVSGGAQAYYELAESVVREAATRDDRWRDVQSLAMLAVSTMAYVHRATDSTDEREAS